MMMKKTIFYFLFSVALPQHDKNQKSQGVTCTYLKGARAAPSMQDLDLRTSTKNRKRQTKNKSKQQVKQTKQKQAVSVCRSFRRQANSNKQQQDDEEEEDIYLVCMYLVCIVIENNTSQYTSD